MININLTLFGFKIHIYKPYSNSNKTHKRPKNTVPPGSQNKISKDAFNVV